MWSSQAFSFSPHMLDAIGIEELSRLFITSSTKQFHYTCLSAAVVTQKTQMIITMDNWPLSYKRNAIV
jgi:hypothetical protein